MLVPLTWRAREKERDREMASLCINNSFTLYTRTLHDRFSQPATTNTRRKRRSVTIAAESSSSIATEKLGIKIEKNPPESTLTQLGVRNWPKWSCPPSKFPWTYSDKETCYLLEGKVKVTTAGSEESVEFGAGDLVEFPKGMSCTWDVSVGVDKHYNFG